jgi:hypothetical protein
MSPGAGCPGVAPAVLPSGGGGAGSPGGGGGAPSGGGGAP